MVEIDLWILNRSEYQSRRLSRRARSCSMLKKAQLKTKIEFVLTTNRFDRVNISVLYTINRDVNITGKYFSYFSNC